jgi:hypothetical protein
MVDLMQGIGKIEDTETRAKTEKAAAAMLGVPMIGAERQIGSPSSIHASSTEPTSTKMSTPPVA